MITLLFFLVRLSLLGEEKRGGINQNISQILHIRLLENKFDIKNKLMLKYECKQEDFEQ